MIEKMKYINLMGSIRDLDRVIEQYISKYDIQLEYAVKELYKTAGLTSFTGANPYAEQFRKAEKFLKTAGLNAKDRTGEISKERAYKIIDKAYDFLDRQGAQIHELESYKQAISDVLEKLNPFRNLELNMESLRDFNYINYRFGKMPVSGFLQFEAFLYDDGEMLFLQSERNSEFVWGGYFTPSVHAKKVDSVFSSLHFESIDIPLQFEEYKFSGTPDAVIGVLTKRLEDTQRKLDLMGKDIMDSADISSQDMIAAYCLISELYHCYDCRKYAAHTSQDFYIFVGWMTEKDSRRLLKQLEEDKDVVLILEEDNDSIVSKPPTKLKNPFFIRPFEFFVKMYGIPAYNEIDPTPFVALTYSIIFGMMFGDVGQGAVLALVGYLLYKKKGYMLGSIFTVVGCFSVFFGFMYGSIFGFENDAVLKAIWLRPTDSDKIMTVLLTAVGLGVCIILVSMIINMLNAIKNKQLGRLLFGANGLSGFIFYSIVLFLVLMVVVGNPLPSGGLIAIAVGVPLLFVTLQVPLTKLVEKKKKKEEHGESLGMFILETLMELIEVLLSYFTNTVSFVRIGGFAISHGGLMLAVMVLSGAESGNANFIVVILGNILVMCIEGLVVGIQVLRLEFYEMFSRYYSGNGKEFISYKKSLSKYLQN